MPIAVAAAMVIVALLIWRLRASGFRGLSWQSIGVASALFWGVLAALLISAVWDDYYGLFVPPWYRYAAPLGSIILYSLLGLALRWLALRLPGHPVLVFCLVGGIESIPEHAVGIYRFGILQLPILQGSTAASIFAFAFFEYVTYWAITLLLAIGVDRLVRRLRPRTSVSPEQGG